MGYSQRNFTPQHSSDQATNAPTRVKRRAYDGRSIELGPEVLMHQFQPPEIIKDEESTRAPKATFSPNRLMWLGAVMITIITLWKIYDLRSKSLATNQDAAKEVAMTQVTDQRVHAAILQTVTDYLQSDRLQTMLPLVRNPEQTRKRMEKYYAMQPFTPQKCLSLESMEPFSYQDRRLWNVVARVDEETCVELMLEEIPDGRFLVDWESHIDYQPMYWEQYILKQPRDPMSFRVTAESSSYYAKEFSDESQWVSYLLRQKNSEHMVHGYVQRNTPLHKMMEKALSHGPRRMILRLQTSKEIAARKTVIIKELVSDSIYRIEPPTSLID